MTDLATIPLKTIDGGAASLGDYAGKVLLVVNVASKCGLTPQYSALQALYERFAGQGVEVLGFPANDFAGQEPGEDAEIASFCDLNFGVTFPMFAKIAVTGEQMHPLYRELTSRHPARDNDHQAFADKLAGFGVKPQSPSDVLWNFEKFLVGKDGEVVARFSPDLAPDDAQIVSAIERELAR